MHHRARAAVGRLVMWIPIERDVNKNKNHEAESERNKNQHETPF